MICNGIFRCIYNVIFLLNWCLYFYSEVIFNHQHSSILLLFFFLFPFSFLFNFHFLFRFFVRFHFLFLLFSFFSFSFLCSFSFSFPFIFVFFQCFPSTLKYSMMIKDNTSSNYEITYTTTIHFLSTNIIGREGH